MSSVGGQDEECPLRILQKENFGKEEWKNEIVAVTYENGEKFFSILDTQSSLRYTRWRTEKVVNSAVQSTNGQGHGALAGVLKESGVDTLICGGIGGGARMALQEAGVQLYAGVSGDADQAVASLLAGTLVQNAEATCDHHGHGHHEEGGCGEP